MCRAILARYTYVYSDTAQTVLVSSQESWVGDKSDSVGPSE